MNEENNLDYYGGVVSTTTDGCIITTTGGDYVISNDRLMYNTAISYGTPYDMDFKLPDIFMKVIKKMIPEIKNIIVSRTLLNMTYSDQIESLMIDMFIVLDESSTFGNQYEERIRDLFRMTFPNIDYVVLNVKQLDLDASKKFSEMIGLFGK